MTIPLTEIHGVPSGASVLVAYSGEPLELRAVNPLLEVRLEVLDEACRREIDGSTFTPPESGVFGIVWRMGGASRPLTVAVVDRGDVGPLRGHDERDQRRVLQNVLRDPDDGPRVLRRIAQRRAWWVGLPLERHGADGVLLKSPNFGAATTPDAED